jgi:hypothetical protein
MRPKEIIIDVKDRIATITLNRPAQLNAWTAAQGPHHRLRADRPNLISQRKTAAQLQIESGWRQT